MLVGCENCTYVGWVKEWWYNAFDDYERHTDFGFDKGVFLSKLILELNKILHCYKLTQNSLFNLSPTWSMIWFDRWIL